MSRKSLIFPVFLAVCLLSSRIFAQSGTTAVLTIHADRPVSKVSPTLYGLMTEEINHSYEGGLYAELIRNNTFRADWSGVNEWILVEAGEFGSKDQPGQGHGAEPGAALESAHRGQQGECRRVRRVC